MSIGAAHEEVQDEADAVTFSFADSAARLCGFARLGLSGAPGRRRGSALAVLFSNRTPVAAIAEGDVAVDSDAKWDELVLPGLGATVDAPLERWSLRMAGGNHGFVLTFGATSPPAAASAGGYEQLCEVRGEATVEGKALPVVALGQRGHRWGTADWSRLASTHTVCAWMGGGHGVAMTAEREQRAAGHDAGARWGALLTPEAAVEVADPRLSTTYDGVGRQRRAGLELWLDEDPPIPRRAAGTLLCGSSLELGQLRLDCSFMRWTMDGAEGIGRYDILRLA